VHVTNYRTANSARSADGRSAFIYFRRCPQVTARRVRIGQGGTYIRRLSVGALRRRIVGFRTSPPLPAGVATQGVPCAKWTGIDLSAINNKISVSRSYIPDRQLVSHGRPVVLMSNPAPTVHLSQIGQIAVNVRDLDRAVTFYQQTLGMKLLFRMPTMAFFDCSGVRLMLAPPEKPEFDHPASVIYYKVADLPAVHTALAAAQVKFEAPPHLIARMPDHDLWMAFLRDSEGNLVGLMSEVRGKQT
jgi:catechol 2,3-dioxygenase-like lactoylglutathione lyase family enzyme